jgi:hypothetical protein
LGLLETIKVFLVFDFSSIKSGGQLLLFIFKYILIFRGGTMNIILYTTTSSNILRIMYRIWTYYILKITLFVVGIGRYFDTSTVNVII